MSQSSIFCSFRGDYGMASLESKFQSDLVKQLEKIFPTAIIFKNEGKQGLPDITVLHENGWALLECKRSKDSRHQPNQDYYVNKANEMSFSSFIYPENQEEVLDALQQAFRTGRETRLSESE